MALSGSIETTVNTHWTLKLSWSATQSVSGNYSTVTAKLHWIADSYGAVYSSATKTCNITVAGSSSNYSSSSMAALSDGQDKIIHTYTKQVNHNSDGTGSFSLDGWFEADVDISGYVGTINLTAKTFTLDTIPRASTLVGGYNWTAPNDITFTISSHSSSFTHTCDIYVNGTKIKTTGSMGTSGTAGFSTTDNTNIFKQLNGGQSQDTKVVLNTYSGSTLIGTDTKIGTVSIPNETTVTIANPTGVSSTAGQENSTVWFDQSITLNIDCSNTSFTTTINFKTSNSGSVIHSISGLSGSTSSTSYTFTSSEQAMIYGIDSTSIEFDGQMDVYTYYNGTQVGSTQTPDINYRLRNNAPSFPSTSISYSDSNSTTSTLTGNSQYIIQNQSTLTATINTNASMKYGATIKNYAISCNGLTGSLITTGSYSLGKITAGSNVTLSITVTDSRGASATATKTVTVIPYSSPTISAKALRTDNFETETTLTISGSLSPVMIGTSNKNASFKTHTYAYKVSTAGSYPTGTSFTPSYSSDGKTYTVPSIVLSTQLDNLSSWNILVTIQDQISGAVTYTINVPTGQPLLFIDSALKSTGINQFPVNPNSFEVTGDMWINGVTSRADDAPIASVFGSDVTQKVYLNFVHDASSNDPAFIMHETSNVTASVNRGVLHICPTDDNDNVNDYVSIHGTNDPETIKLYTGGNIVTTGSITGGTGNFASFELTGTTPYIDFKNSSTDDYDVRLLLKDNDTLEVDGGSLLINGGLTTLGGNFKAGGTDFTLGDPSNGRGNGGRAMVQQTNNQLVINYGGDFGGGVEVQGSSFTFAGRDVWTCLGGSGNMMQQGRSTLSISASGTGSAMGHATTTVTLNPGFPTAMNGVIFGFDETTDTGYNSEIFGRVINSSQFEISLHSNYNGTATYGIWWLAQGH